MYRRVLVFAFTLATLLLTTGCIPASHHPWLPYAIEEAAQQKKPLVIEFYATWCKPCARFEENILKQPRVQQALQDVVFIRYDIDSRAGRDAYLRCRARSVPTFVGIDSGGHIRLLKEGTESSADEFLVFLAEAKAVLGTEQAR